MNIILLGPPGSGKGTQARMLQSSYNLALIATGDILREEVEKKTELGEKIKDTMEKGGFPADEIVLKVFQDHLKQVKNKGVILDGIPRTLNQAQKLDEIFDQLGLTLDAVIQLSVDEGELIRRLSMRVICKDCGMPVPGVSSLEEAHVCAHCGGSQFIRRPDDKAEVVKTRLDIYNKQVDPLHQYYSKSKRLQVVDGMKPAREVKEHIEFLLEKMQVLTKKEGCLYSAQDC